MPHKQGIGGIFGITSEDGVAAQKRVVLMDRSNLTIVGRTTADAIGGYAFTGLNTETNDYLVMAVDDDGTPRKEAIARDYITPIPSHIGATYWGNWQKLAQQKFLSSAYLGLIDNAGLPYSPIPNSMTKGYGSPPTYNQPSLTPGAPHLPATLLSGANIASGARYDNWLVFTNPLKVSAEWVFKRSTAVGRPCVAAATFINNGGGEAGATSIFATNWNYGSNGPRPIIVMEYRVSNSTLYLYRANGTGAFLGDMGVWTSLALVTSYNLSSAPDVVHIVGTLHYGTEGKIYVNGTLAATGSLTSTQASIVPTIASVNGTAGIGLADYGSNGFVLNALTTVLTGPFALYVDTLLSASDVTAHYNALMVGSAVTETGYAKEVIIDAPRCFYRLKEADGTAGFKSWLTPDRSEFTASIYNPGAISYSQASPVTGGSMLLLNGSGFRNSYASSTNVNKKEFSYEFLYKPVGATPAALEYLVATTDGATGIYTAVTRETTGYLAVRYYDGGALRTQIFNSVTLSTSVVSHVAITVNKVDLTAKLYVNKVLAQTITITNTLFDLAADYIVSASPYAFRLSVGGLVNDAATSITSPMNGYIGEVAYYPVALSAARVAAHYDAMTTP